MKTLEFIKANGGNVQALNDAFGITVKEYPEEGLFVLNYSQIDSPRTDPVVIECRGLIIDSALNVVSRSFDRFFNLNEAPDTQAHLDWDKATIFSKMDGSLIKLYHWNDKWHFATRGTAFAESDCMGFGVTFKELCLKASNATDDEELQRLCANAELDKDITYILELTCRENRVVTVYEGTKLHFLAARNNKTGEFVSVDRFQTYFLMGWEDVEKFSFGNPEEIVKAAEALPNLQEGYVVYQDGKPVCKVKSPAYVAVHHLRGNGTPNVNRVMELVCIGEEEEYLTYFPEDTEYFTDIIEAREKLLVGMDVAYSTVSDIEDQKDFALAIKNLSYTWVLFQARKLKIWPSEVYNQATLQRRVATLEGYIKAKK